MDIVYEGFYYGKNEIFIKLLSDKGYYYVSEDNGEWAPLLSKFCDVK